MKSNKQSLQLKILTVCAALLTAALRAAHYAFGMDGRSLLVANHWSVIGLWVVSVAFALLLLLCGRSIKDAGNCSDAYPASLGAAVGCFALSAGLVVTSLQQYGYFELPADRLVWAMGLLTGVGLLVVGICRLTGKKPYFLFHAALCLFFTLRMIAQYRHWSADPQLHDYGFYLCAHVAVMLTSYHHAAFDTGLGNRRALWIGSLCAVYLCCAAVPHCDEALLMAACALWALTNLAVFPLYSRRTRPVFRSAEEAEE